MRRTGCAVSKGKDSLFNKNIGIRRKNVSGIAVALFLNCDTCAYNVYDENDICNYCEVKCFIHGSKMRIP